MRSDMTFQSFADSVVTDIDLSSTSISFDDTSSKDNLSQRYPASTGPIAIMKPKINKDYLSQRYPALTGLITIMKPKINRVDKISIPSFIEDVFNDNTRFEYCSDIDIPDELIICLIDELYGVDTPEKLNNQQISIIKVLAVYIIISTYTA